MKLYLADTKEQYMIIQVYMCITHVYMYYICIYILICGQFL